MKSLIRVFVVTLCLIAPVHANDLVIAISPNQSPDQATAQAKYLLQILTGLKAGQSATLVDGYNIRTLGTFTVPTDKRYSSAKARIAYNRATVAALLQFAKSANGYGSYVRAPQLLRHVSQNYAGEDKTDIVILGSALYHDLAAPDLSMAGGLIPSDGHFQHTRADTVYGIADSADSLANIRVHYGYVPERILQSDRHIYHVQRFWTLYVSLQSGEMVSFTHDLNALFRKVRSKVKVPKHSYTPEDTDKLQMIRLTRGDQSEEKAETPKEPSIYERAVSTAPLSKSQVIEARGVQIGLTWDCASCDLDLYAQAHEGAPVLYFGNSNTEQGEHWKDYLTSPQAENGYETIAFHVPVDLREVLILINFYSGSAENGVRGELRLAAHGHVYARAFHLPATKGNHATGFTGSSTLDHDSILLSAVSMVVAK